MMPKSLKVRTFMKILALVALILALPGLAWLANSKDASAPAAPVTVAARAPRPPAPEAAPEPPPPPRRPERRAWLGVFLSDEEGARVEGVQEDSPAEKAGLREGDKILEIDGEKVEDARDVRQVMRDREPGDKVQIRVERKGKGTTLTATLGESPREVLRHRELRPWDEEGEFRPGHFWMMENSRLYIGVRVQSMTEDLREYFKAPRGAGLLVSKVVTDTPAAKAGLRAGDVIIEVDEKKISDQGDLREALAEHEPGDRVPIRIVRDGSEKTVEVEVAERPGSHSKHGSFLLPRPDEDEDLNMESFGEEGREEIHKALEQAMEELEQTKLERQEMFKKLQETMKQLEFSGQQKEMMHRQIRQAMEQAREAVRQARRSIATYVDASI